MNSGLMRNKQGYLALHLAQRNHNCDETIISMLIQASLVSAMMMDGFGDTALHIECAGRARYAVIAEIIAADPMVCYIVDRKGELPLHLAITNDLCTSTSTLYLIKYGPDAVFVRDSYGDLPIHDEYSGKSHIEVIGKLLGLYPQSITVTNHHQLRVVVVSHRPSFD
jgi:ankyrin repeat protein